MIREEILKNKADLRGSDLRGADLREANLREANLCWADLRVANLNWADLRGADLREANLREANLRGANLCEANLNWADLRGAKYDYLTIGIHPPQTGELIAFKKVWSSNGSQVVITLRIDKETPRSCATTRKYRSWGAFVLEAPEGCYSRYGTKYIKGQYVMPDSFDLCRWNECSHGIHWFLTREEAEAWEL